MKTFKIEIPDGFEIDKEKSTFENIVFKEIKKENPMLKVYKYHNTTEEEFKQKFKDFPEYLKAYQQEVMIASFYNKGWIPNWDDYNESKYYPYFYMQENDFRLACSTYFGSTSTVSSRLCFRKKEDLLEAVELYLDVYKKSRL